MMLITSKLLYDEEEESQTVDAPTEGQIIKTWCKRKKTEIRGTPE